MKKKGVVQLEVMTVFVLVTSALFLLLFAGAIQRQQQTQDVEEQQELAVLLNGALLGDSGSITLPEPRRLHADCETGSIMLDSVNVPWPGHVVVLMPDISSDRLNTRTSVFARPYPAARITVILPQETAITLAGDRHTTTEVASMLPTEQVVMTPPQGSAFLFAERAGTDRAVMRESSEGNITLLEKQDGVWRAYGTTAYVAPASIVAALLSDQPDCVAGRLRQRTEDVGKAYAKKAAVLRQAHAACASDYEAAISLLQREPSRQRAEALNTINERLHACEPLY